MEQQQYPELVSAFDGLLDQLQKVAPLPEAVRERLAAVRTGAASLSAHLSVLDPSGKEQPTSLYNLTYGPRPRPAEPKWYSIRNQATETAQLLIYGDIGVSPFSEGVIVKQLVEELSKITAPVLNVRINSPGGSFFDGIALYHSLRAHPSRIVVDVDGLAASVASVVALAGDTVRMASSARWMIHDPSGLINGSAEDLRGMASLLDSIKQTLVDIYQQRTHMAANEIADLMEKETWYDARQALDAGFIDEITGAMAVAARYDLRSRYKNAPTTPDPRDIERRRNAERMRRETHHLLEE